MAAACLHLLEHYDGPEQVNVGTGRDATIREIAGFVAEAVGYEGETEWDTSKPDGTPQKLLDVSKLRDAGWEAQIGLREGIASTVAWYRENKDRLGGGWLRGWSRDARFAARRPSNEQGPHRVRWGPSRLLN